MILGSTLGWLPDCGWGTLVLVACCVALAVIWLVGEGTSRSGRFPPGPTGLPFVGYLPFLGKEPFLDFIELGKKYGDVFSVKLGSERVLVLNSAEAIREAYLKPEFLARPPVSTLETINPGSPFFSGDMQLWRDQRRFVVRALKDLGLGRTVIEDAVQDEVGHFLDALSNHDDSGAAVDINGPLNASVSNNISALIFGRRLPYDHPDKQLLDSNLETAVKYIDQMDNYIYFPWLKHIPFLVEWFQINKAIQGYAKIRDFFSREIASHKTTLDPKHPRDLLDLYLMEMESRRKDDTSYTEQSLLSTLADVFEAGSETTRVTLLWCVYVAAAFPDIQKKVREDIRESGSVDLRSSPYTHAFILEVMRWKTMAPLSVPHCTVQDTSVAGFDVPRGTYVIANLWNAHHDPRHWDKPDAFRPERFLAEDGQTVRKPVHFMPFSVGKRACPGESMAYLEIFHYLSALLKRYEIVFPEEAETPPTFATEISLNYRLLPFKVRLMPAPT